LRAELEGNLRRNIKQLRRSERVIAAEIRAAVRQVVRKVSGFRQPSRANAAGFAAAVAEIGATTETLSGLLTVGRTAAPAAGNRSAVQSSAYSTGRWHP